MGYQGTQSFGEVHLSYNVEEANRLHVVELAQPTHHNATLQPPSLSR